VLLHPHPPCLLLLLHLQALATQPPQSTNKRMRVAGGGI
jgi:hypothetical protein